MAAAVNLTSTVHMSSMPRLPRRAWLMAHVPTRATHKTGTQTKTYPIIGDIVITTYDQGFAAKDTCSLYQIADGSFGQSDLNCAYVKYAKAAEKGLADGTCADHGYSVETGTQTKTYPIIGDIVVTTY